jgi:hypothetical protein
MASKSGTGRGPGDECNGVLSDDESSQVLERLRRGFSEFRRTHRSRARISQTLREATLEAIRQGTEEQEVMRVCGISKEQLVRWRECTGERWKRDGADETRPLVFPVVEDFCGARQLGGGGAEVAEPIELRVGRWSISIRPLGW